MTGIADYLHAATLLGLSREWKRIPADYFSPTEALLLLKDVLATEKDLPGLADVLKQMAAEGSVRVISDELAGDFYQFERQQIDRALELAAAQPGGVAGRMQVVGLKLFHAALERHDAGGETPISSVAAQPVSTASPAASVVSGSETVETGAPGSIITIDKEGEAFSDFMQKLSAAEEALAASGSFRGDETKEAQLGLIRQQFGAGRQHFGFYSEVHSTLARGLFLAPLRTALEFSDDASHHDAVEAAIEAGEKVFCG